MLWAVPWVAVALLSMFLVDWYRRQPRLTRLTSRFVLITGCDTGFGKLLVQRLDSLGCHVFAGCLTEAGQVELRQACTQRVNTVSLDVTDPESVRRAFEFVANVVTPNDGLWGLVNNAAIPGVSLGPLEWMAADDFRRVSEVNSIGLIDVTLTFLPLLKRARGRVINMSGTGGRLPGPLALPYDVSKAAVEAFSDGLRRHLRMYEYDVTVHVIEPSLFRTEMVDPERHRRLLEVTWRRLPAGCKEEYGEHFYTEYMRHWAETMTHAASTEYHKVIDAYVHALTSVCPRTRYTVGYRALLFSIPLSYLPTALVDWVICKVHPKIRKARSGPPILPRENGAYQHVGRNVRFVSAHN